MFIIDQGLISILLQMKDSPSIKNCLILTPLQKAKLIKNCTCIHYKLIRFCAIQRIFMPATCPFLTTANQNVTPPTGYTKQEWDNGSEIDQNDLSDKPLPVELQHLFLPSDLPPNIHVMCHLGLDGIEEQLQDAQCCSSLDDVQTQMYIKAGPVTMLCTSPRNEYKNAWRASAEQHEGKTASSKVQYFSYFLFQAHGCWQRFDWMEENEGQWYLMHAQSWTGQEVCRMAEEMAEEEGIHTRAVWRTSTGQVWVKVIINCCGYGRAQVRMQRMGPG